MRITPTRSVLLGTLAACAAGAFAAPAFAADPANAPPERPNAAPSPEFLDTRRLPLAIPVKPAERVKRDEPAAATDQVSATDQATDPPAPAAGASTAPATAAGPTATDDQRLMAEAEEATQRALEERARSAEVRRRAEELSARFAKDEKAKSEKTADPAPRLIPAATTESAAEAAATTEAAAPPVTAAPPPPPAKPAAKKQTSERRAKRPAARAANAGKPIKGERSALGAQVQVAPPPPPKDEGLFAKMKRNINAALGW